MGGIKLKMKEITRLVPPEYRTIVTLGISAGLAYYIYRLWKRNNGNLNGLPDGYSVNINTNKIADTISNKYGLQNAAHDALRVIVQNVVSGLLFK